MAGPVFYKSVDEAVRAASSSISFNAQRAGNGEHATREVIVDEAITEDAARRTLASIMEEMPSEWAEG